MYGRGWSWDTYHSLWELVFDSQTGTLESDRPALRNPKSGEPAPTFGMEYPQINQALTGKKNRFVYVAACSTSGQLGGPSQGVHLGQSFGGVKRKDVGGRETGHYFDCVQKYDLCTGDVETHVFGEGLEPSEVEFVPRRGAVEEDDGYLIAFVYNNAKHTTDVVVLDAAKVQDAPVCIVHLPTHVALTFHGNFVPA
jgi:carotenoid cleavage dioxygenase-like enzyme